MPSSYNDLPVTLIESGGFKSLTGLKVLNIPDTMTDCSEATAFDGDTALTAINVYKVNGNHDVRYASIDGVLFYDNANNGVELKYYPLGKTGEYVIPASVDFAGNVKTITSLPVNALKNAKITKITIPYTISTINASSFSSNSSLTDIIFAETPEGEAEVPLTLSTGAFTSLTKLTSITLPTRLGNIDPSIFSSCRYLVKVNIAGKGGKYSSIDGVLTNAAETEIIYVANAFAGQNGYGTYVVPESVTSIAAGAFVSNTKVTELVVHEYLRYIGEEAFKSCTALKKITFVDAPDEELQYENIGLEIAASAFYGCSGLTEVTFPKQLGKVGVNAFGATSNLVTVTVNSVGEVDFADKAFASVTTASTGSTTYYVRYVTIGKYTGAFNVTGVFGPSKLEKLNVDKENTNYFEDVDTGVFYDENRTKLVYVPLRIEGEFILPETIEEIGADSFNSRTLLTKITIGYNVNYIGTDAFYGCKLLAEVVFAPTPEGETAAPLVIGNGAFRNDYALPSITLPDRLVSLGATCFYGCSLLTEITVPASLEEFVLGFTGTGANAQEWFETFEGCSKLERITVDEDNERYCSIDGVLYQKNADGEPEILLLCPRADKGVIPEGSENGKGKLVLPATLKKILYRAFYYSNVSEISFGGEVDGLVFGEQVFNYANTEKITLPVGITAIAPNTFQGAKGITTLVIPWTVESIGYGAFNGCSNLLSLDFMATPDGEAVRPLRFEDAKLPTSTSPSAYYGIFYGCSKILSIEFPERTTYIGAYCCNYPVNNALRIVSIPSTVEEIADYAFYYGSSSKLTKVIFGTRDEVGDSGETVKTSDLKTIGYYAFGYSNVTSLDIPDSVTSIDSRAFYNCSNLRSVHVPAGLEALKDYTFYGCGALTEVTLPEGLKEIGASAFYRCEKLKKIVIPSTVEVIGGSAFYYCSDLNELTFATDEQGFSALRSMGINTFAYTAIEEFIFPETRSVVNIGTTTWSGTNVTYNKSIFYNCKKLKKVHISTNITNIDDMFANCNSVTEITVADGNENFRVIENTSVILNGLGTVVKLGISPNGELVIPEGITEIAAKAFQGQIGLTKITLPASLKTIGNMAFENCSELTEVTFDIGEGATSALVNLGESSFRYCAKLKKALLPEDAYITTLPITLFYGCVSLEEVTIPTAVETISRSCFYNCSSLRNIDVSNVSFGETSFYGTSCFTEYEFKTNISYGKDIFKYADSITKVTIESGFTSIAGNLLGYMTGLKEIVIPTTVKEIKASAFTHCESLEVITLPFGLTKIGDKAFEYCTALHTIKLPSTLTSIGASAFAYSGLTEISIPLTVTSIGAQAFSDTALLNKVTFESADVSFLNSLSIGYQAFANTPQLKSFAFPKRFAVSSVGTSYSTNGGRLFMGSAVESVTLNEGLTNIAYDMFFKAENLKSIVIPSSVTAIGYEAFGYTALLTSVTFAEGSKLKSMGDYVFRNSGNIESITLPASLEIKSTSTSRSMFEGSGVISVTIPNSTKWTHMPSYTFRDAVNLTSVTFTDGCPYLMYFGSNVFAGTVSLESIEMPINMRLLTYGTSTTNDGASMFYGSGIKSFHFPKSSLVATNSMFRDAVNLTKVTSENPIQAIDSYAFYNTKIDDFDFSAVKSIASYAFAGSSITKVETNCNLVFTKIGANAFENCKSLTKVEIADSITEVGASAFDGCTALSSVTFTGDSELSSIGKYAFRNTVSLKNITLPSTLASVNATLSEGFFKGSGLESVVLPEGVTVVPNSAFENCACLASVTFNGELTEIGDLAFYGTALTRFNAAETLEKIGCEAFAYCSALAEISVSARVESIGEAAFAACPALVAISEENAVYEVIDGCIVEKDTGDILSVPSSLSGEYVVRAGAAGYHPKAFEGSKITSVIVEEGVLELPAYAFYKMEALEHVTLPDTLAFIGDFAFADCKALGEITLPSKVESFGQYLFDGCENLTKVVFAYGTEYINGKSDTTQLKMFRNTPNLNEVVFPSTLKKAGYYMFAESTITDITLPEGMTETGDYSFAESKVERVYLPKTIKTISRYSFYRTLSLKEIYVPAGVEKIDTYAFSGAGYKEDDGANEVESVLIFYYVEVTEGDEDELKAFKEFKVATAANSLANMYFDRIIFEDGVTSIEIISGGTTYGLYYSYFSEIVFPSTLTSIKGKYFFCGTLVEEIVVPEGVETIGEYLFYNAKGLKRVTLPSTLKEIATYAFYNVSTVEYIVIPRAVETIGEYAFFGWTEDQTVYFEVDPENAPRLASDWAGSTQKVRTVFGSSGPTAIGE